MQAVWGGVGDDAAKGRDYPARSRQLGSFVRTQYAEDTASSRYAGAHACRSVFDDDAVGGGEAEELCAGDVGLGVRLAVDDIVAGDDASRKLRKLGGLRGGR